MTNNVEPLKAAAPGKYDRTEVLRIVNSIIHKMEGTAQTHEIVKELKALLEVIESIRGDMAQTRAHEVGSTHVPSATDELDAVIDATKIASDDIMNACDAISAAVGDNQVVMDQVTKIYEACSFQDITGQRIRKVVNVLKEIETKVGKLLGILQIGGAANIEDTRIGDAKLLNGPQLPANAVSQEDIDKLLASFD